MWRFASSFEPIPKDCDLMVAVIDHDGQHALEFPCHWRDGYWIEVKDRSHSRSAPDVAQVAVQ